MSEQSEAKVLRVVEELCRQLNPQQTRVVNASSHLEWDLGIGSLERAELIRRLAKVAHENNLLSRATVRAHRAAVG